MDFYSCGFIYESLDDGFLEGLMDIARSIAFIEERGTDLEKVRIQNILFGQKPEVEVIQGLLKLQNKDGGFPYDMVEGNLSTINKSSVALLWMEELGFLNSPAADRVADYLLSIQCDDGGWDEDPAIVQYDLPPWITPGELRTRAYLSSISTYWLSIIGVGDRQAILKALEFLQRLQDETGKFYGYLHTTWIATSCFLMAGHHYSDIVEQGLQVLMDRHLSEWEASQIAWALDCLGKAGLQGNHPFVAQALTELIKRVRSDGSWKSEDGETSSVGAVIGVLKAFKHLGII